MVFARTWPTFEVFAPLTPPGSFDTTRGVLSSPFAPLQSLTTPAPPMMAARTTPAPDTQAPTSAVPKHDPGRRCPASATEVTSTGRTTERAAHATEATRAAHAPSLTSSHHRGAGCKRASDTDQPPRTEVLGAGPARGSVWGPPPKRRAPAATLVSADVPCQSRNATRWTNPGATPPPKQRNHPGPGHRSTGGTEAPQPTGTLMTVDPCHRDDRHRPAP